jgi:O-antigen/teichoic acid export membrane protein
LTGAGAVLNLLLNLIVIPFYSFVGAAWTTLATEVFIMVVSLILVQRYIEGMFNSFLFVKIFIFAFCMTAFLYSSSAVGIVSQIILYCLMFPLLLLLLKFLNWKDIKGVTDRFTGHGEMEA